MDYPRFFDDVQKIRLYDPLAQFLGATSDGILEYGYFDAVRMAGHSCPTVAGAYLATLKALAFLYREGLPERGGIRVEFRDERQNGVTGVIASVVTLMTGATQDNGFKGIGGRFDRRDRLYFGCGFEADMRFARIDNGATVDVTYHADRVGAAPGMVALLPKVLAGGATSEEHRVFRDLWQDRVRRILIDNFDDAEMLVLSESPVPTERE
ncbi:MAG: hypothetical protein M0T84_04470 [Betaproteobacteria bacterium]|nr:hypothetical protein [Betaproteobacteria bacterium]